MITIVQQADNDFLRLISDDPVRPEIPVAFRVSNGRFVSVLTSEDGTVDAIVCVSLHNQVPDSVESLDPAIPDSPTAAIFYTIWSYKSKAGARCLLDTVDSIRRLFPSVTRFVTLSPKTEMARVFHFKNGAKVYRENADTVNYEYFT